MDPFRICLALGPIAVYLLLLGGINLHRRPLVVSGARDMAALGLALSGAVIVGPLELFMPVAAAINFGSFVWVLLIALYSMALAALLLLQRPRIVIYNLTSGELRPVLAGLVRDLDPEARWAGDSLSLPGLGVQLFLEDVPAMRNVSLVATHGRQDYQGWSKLEISLGRAIEELAVPRNPRGLSLLVAGSLLVGLLVLLVSRNPDAVAQSLSQLFTR